MVAGWQGGGVHGFGGPGAGLGWGVRRVVVEEEASTLGLR